MIGFRLINLVSGERHTFCVMRKRLVCKCGCRGWCSYRPIFAFATWSLRALAEGKYPSERHDKKPWHASDAERAGKAGNPFKMQACLLGIMGDWSEYCGTFGFANWASTLRPCLKCVADPGNMYSRIPECSPVSLPWHCVTSEDYDAACSRCETHVLVDAPLQALLANNLLYDKRRAGNRGRCLARGFPELGLLEGDRLEPSESLPDIGCFEQATTPIRVTFWRVSQESG
eukprot:1285462-Alexandrium_andersonii.AAC.1